MDSKHPHYTNSKILAENQELQRLPDERHSICYSAGIIAHKKEDSCMP